MKNTIRKIVKLQKEKKADLKQLKKVMEKILRNEQVKMGKFDKNF